MKIIYFKILILILLAVVLWIFIGAIHDLGYETGHVPSSVSWFSVVAPNTKQIPIPLCPLSLSSNEPIPKDTKFPCRFGDDGMVLTGFRMIQK